MNNYKPTFAPPCISKRSKVAQWLGKTNDFLMVLEEIRLLNQPIVTEPIFPISRGIIFCPLQYDAKC